MKYSTKLSDAIHILALIHLDVLNDLTSKTIAISVHTNPAFVRQIMLLLRRGGIIHSVKGHAAPDLSRTPEEITLLDVYKAIEGDKPLLHLDTHTNPECGVGVNIQLSLQQYYDRVQQKAEEEMANITLKDIIDTYRTLLDKQTTKIML